jgi:hypothetical protein
MSKLRIETPIVVYGRGAAKFGLELLRVYQTSSVEAALYLATDNLDPRLIGNAIAKTGHGNLIVVIPDTCRSYALREAALEHAHVGLFSDNGTLAIVTTHPRMESVGAIIDLDEPSTNLGVIPADLWTPQTVGALA